MLVTKMESKMKNIFSILALFLVVTFGMGAGCRVDSVTVNGSHTRTTTSTGTTTQTTTVGASVVIKPEEEFNATGNDFFVVWI